jgi:hypothetical protein
VKIASCQLSGEASTWFERLVRHQEEPPWGRFKKEMMDRFGDLGEDFDEALMQLR